MKRLTKIVAIIDGFFALAVAVFLIWAYSPVPTFEPASYKVVAPDYCPTDGWRYSTPEDQGMNWERFVAKKEFYE